MTKSALKVNGSAKRSKKEESKRPETSKRAKIARIPAYKTKCGVAYAMDSRELLQSLPSESVSLVITSPPYALQFKKEYGNAEKQDYPRVTTLLERGDY